MEVIFLLKHRVQGGGGDGDDTHFHKSALSVVKMADKINQSTGPAAGQS